MSLERCPFCDASYSTMIEVARHLGRSDCRRDYESRQRAIRAVVAAQWAVACTRLVAFVELNDDGVPVEVYRTDRFEPATQALGALPTPEQVVDGTG